MRYKLLPLLLLLVLAVTGCSGAGTTTQGSQTLESFTAQTLDGGTFTEDDIAAKDLTVMNFWMTTCRPCINEMPDIAEFEKALPENVQLVTVCLFGEEDTREVQGVVDATGYTGTTLLSGDGDFQTLCDAIQATPTTVFVNSEGKIVGDPIIGAQEDFSDTMLEAMNTILTDEGKAAIELD